jgi:hypothetical protein
VMKNTHIQKYQSLKKVDGFYRAEIRLGKLDLAYQLKLAELRGNEASFLIKKDSSIFNKLEVGKVLKMKYWTCGKTKTVKFTQAKVKNIVKHNQKLITGNYLVRLSISTFKGVADNLKNAVDQQKIQEQLHVVN